MASGEEGEVFVGCSDPQQKGLEACNLAKRLKISRPHESQGPAAQQVGTRLLLTGLTGLTGLSYSRQQPAGLRAAVWKGGGGQGSGGAL